MPCLNITSLSARTGSSMEISGIRAVRVWVNALSRREQIFLRQSRVPTTAWLSASQRRLRQAVSGSLKILRSQVTIPRKKADIHRSRLHQSSFLPNPWALMFSTSFSMRWTVKRPDRLKILANFSAEGLADAMRARSSMRQSSVPHGIQRLRTTAYSHLSITWTKTLSSRTILTVLQKQLSHMCSR